MEAVIARLTAFVRLAAVSTVATLLVAACSDDSSTETTTTTSTTVASTTTTTVAPTTTLPAPTTTAPEPEWAVDTSVCSDPDAATARLGPVVHIASVMPLSGGVVASAYVPVRQGLEAAIDEANASGVLAGVTLELDVGDDQANAASTPAVVTGQIDAGAALFTAIAGTDSNRAVRDLLNSACIPQLNALSGAADLNDAIASPWTTAMLVPAELEARVYVDQIAAAHPAGATVALFSTDNEYGRAYTDTVKALAAEHQLTIVGDALVAAGDTTAPALQITGLAASLPQVIIAAPSGAGCLTFLSELASARSVTTGWLPEVYVANGCNSSRLLRAAGPAADGIFTSDNLLDVTDPVNAASPEVQAFQAAMAAKGVSAVDSTAAVGWAAGRLTVAILVDAASSPQGLTRASIIDAARRYEGAPALARPGVIDTMHGTDDPVLAQSLQVLQYHAATGTFTDVGGPVTTYETVR